MNALEVQRQIRALADDLERMRKTDIGGVVVAYTVTMTGGTSPGDTTYSARAGAYMRMGRLVQAQGRVSWSAATGTGVTRISLPFTSTSTANLFSAVSLATDSVTFAGAAPQGLIRPGTAYFELSYPVSNAAAVDIAVEATGSVFFHATYFTD